MCDDCPTNPSNVDHPDQDLRKRLLLEEAKANEVAVVEKTTKTTSKAKNLTKKASKITKTTGKKLLTFSPFLFLAWEYYSTGSMI